MLQQRLSDTGVPRVGFHASAEDEMDIIANATAKTQAKPDERLEPLQHEDIASTAAVPIPARAAAATVKPSILSSRLPVMQSPLPHNLNYTARELDERGMDEAAFQQLRDQLLEARREDQGGSVNRDDAHIDQHRTGSARPRRPRSAMSSGGTSVVTSGASTPYSTDSSYDPAADSDLGHLDIIEGEVDGMPARLSKRQRQMIQEREEEAREVAASANGTGWSKLRRMIKIGTLRKGDEIQAEEGAVMDASPPAPTSEPKPYVHDDDQGPTNMKSVPVTTSSGTHGGDEAVPKRKPTKYERQAARLVRAHRLVSTGAAGSTGSLLAALPSTPGLDPTLAAAAFGSAGHDDHSDHDEAHSRSSSPELDLDPRPVATGGVLGNLLRLYEPHRTGLSRDVSTTSPLDTPSGPIPAADAAVSSASANGPSRSTHGGSRLRTSYLPTDSPASELVKSSERHHNVGQQPKPVEAMTPSELAARALEKERQARVREIEERLRRTVQTQSSHSRRKRHTQSSSLAGLMTAEFKRQGTSAQTPRRSIDGMSIASSNGGDENRGGRRPMSRASSAFPIPASVIDKTQKSGKVISKAATHVAKVAVSETGLEAAIDERPKAARNAGGTIGALIATTGNLVGAVSPHLAQLGPNPHRSGFTLDRYLLPEMNAKTLRQTAEIIADAAVPLRRSLPSTPAGWSSRSAPGSAGHATPVVPTSRSATDLLSRLLSNNSAENTLANSPTIKLGGVKGSRSAPATPPAISITGSGTDTLAPGTGTHTEASNSPKGGSGTLTNGPKYGSDVDLAQAPAARSMSRGLSATSHLSQSLGSRSTPATPGGGLGSHLRSRSSHALHQIQRVWTGLHSGLHTPEADGVGTDYFSPRGTGVAGSVAASSEEIDKLEWQRKLKRRQKKRKKQEIFITMHVAEILQRQEFILKLARALMMFGAPTHKLESQIQHTARVLEINCRIIYLPNLMLLSFGDETTRTSETRFLKQTASLDLTKLTNMHDLFRNVIRDKISVTEASEQLDVLMRRKPLIPRIPTILVGGFCSAFICVGPMGFGGSFIDAVAAFPLGMFLVFCQGIVTTELYSNVFEIVFCVLNSFIAAALHSTNVFCYSAVVSGSIVLILPGFIVLSGALELQSKNLIAGSVRLVYALIYSLFLGIGLSIGVDFWALVRGRPIDNASFCDATHHDPSVWYRRPVQLSWAFLTVPGYSIVLSLRNQAKVTRKEFPAMVLVACAGWATNHFSSTARTLQGRQDITSALGSFVVGLLGQAYGRFTGGRAFVVAVTGILYQLPSGLSNGGLLNFVADATTVGQTSTSGSTAAFSNSGFTVAASLIEVALGLTVGLFASTIVAHYLTSKRRRGLTMFSF